MIEVGPVLRRHHNAATRVMPTGCCINARRIVWPNSEVQTLTVIAFDQLHVIEQ